MASQGDRTEKPTARRLREARKKGQVARSRDLAQAATFGAVLVSLGWFGPRLVAGLGEAASRALGRLDRFPARDLNIDEVGMLAFDGLGWLALLVGPIALAGAAAAVAANALQGGWVFATEAVQMNWGRLNPVNGFKRLGFAKGGLDTVRMLVVVSALSALAAFHIVGQLSEAGQLARLSPFEAMRVGWGGAERLLRQSFFVLLAVAAADYGRQRWRHMSELRMTKQEVRDDLRLTEGNPEIKARVRRIQFDITRRRMFAAIPKATVVITNPTEYAVALEYRRGVMSAPRVVAKGRGVLAARIKAIARDHGIPAVENVPLAQALYKTVNVGESIPAALFEAVAEVLAYLIRLKQLAL